MEPEKSSAHLLSLFNDPASEATWQEKLSILIERLGIDAHPTVRAIRSGFYCVHGPNISFGANTFVNWNGRFYDWAPIELGEGTWLGPNVSVYTRVGMPVQVGKRCWLGDKCVIMPGVTIQDDCTVGAGAVVTRDVEKGETVVGSPARPITKGCSKSKSWMRYLFNDGSLTNLERLRAGLVFGRSAETDALYENDERWLTVYNQHAPFKAMGQKERHAMLKANLGSIGQGTVIAPPLYAEFSGNIHLGDGVHIGRDCMLFAMGEVKIGDGTIIGERVDVLASDHPRLPEERYVFKVNEDGEPVENVIATRGVPVTIGSGCYIGDGAIILPGVSIGNGAVVPRGAVVRKDIASTKREK